MSYTALEEQIRQLPEEYLEEVSKYIEFLMYKQLTPKPSKRNLRRFYGSMQNIEDGMTVQRSMRSEWD